MTDVLIAVESVSKAFGRTRALGEAAFALRRGRVHGLVGANAAGKSTLIRILLGLEIPDHGNVTAVADNGDPIRIAYQPQVPVLYDYLTVVEFLELAALLAETSNAALRDDVMDLFGLAAIAGQVLHTVSIGTRMKVALAAALIQEADLLVLDEPTNALDAVSVARLKRRLASLRTSGTTILMATHTISFAEDLCDDITVLKGGRVQYSGTVGQLGDPSATLEARVLALIENGS